MLFPSSIPQPPLQRGPVRINIANMEGNKPQVPVPEGILIDLGDDPGGAVSIQITAPPRRAAADKTSSELLGAIQAALKELSLSVSDSGAPGHVTFSQEGRSHFRSGTPEPASPEQHSYMSSRRISALSRNGTPYANSGPARQRPETPRGRRPRELSRKELMEKLVKTQYIPSLREIIPATRLVRIQPKLSDVGARPTRLGPLRSAQRVYISLEELEELERRGTKKSYRAPVTKPNTEAKNDQKLATIRTNVAPHLRRHTLASTPQPIRLNPGSGPAGTSVLTAAAAAAIVPNPDNTNKTATKQTATNLVPFKAYYPQDVRSRGRAVPAASVDEIPILRPVTQPTRTPPAHLMLTCVKENKQSQFPRPSVPRSLRWLTAPRAWPQPVTATSAGPAAGGHLLPLPPTLAQPRPLAVPRTIAAADLELFLSNSDPCATTVQSGQTGEPAAPASPSLLPSLVPPSVISSPPSKSPTLSTIETLSTVSLQQGYHHDPVSQPGSGPDSTTIRTSAESPMMGPNESALCPAPFNAPEEPDTSLLLIHYGTPEITDFILFEAADAPPQHTMRPSASLEDLLGLDFF
ncbi:hypothetical protein BGX38DRAFT_1139326 [Terfezia claveryi]|nr:hypothetical protein BGX38DRAFT_1139326 [Terfezia claveryi]